MRFVSITGLALLGLANAYPNILAHLEQTSGSKVASLKKRVPFDAASQLVDVTGMYPISTCNLTRRY